MCTTAGRDHGLARNRPGASTLSVVGMPTVLSVVVLLAHDVVQRPGVRIEHRAEQSEPSYLLDGHRVLNRFDGITAPAEHAVSTDQSAGPCVGAPADRFDQDRCGCRLVAVLILVTGYR